MGCLKLCSWEFILSLLINPKLLASWKLRDLFFSAGLSTIPPNIFLPDNMHSFLLASVTPSTWLWYVSFALSHHVYFLLVAFNLNIIRILFLFAMLLVSLLPALLILLVTITLLSHPSSLSSLPFSFSPEISTYFFPFIAVKTSLFLFFLSEIYLSHVGINFSFIILELVSVPLCMSPSLFWLSKMFINIWRGQHTYMATPGASKKKYRQYPVEYLKYGFIQSTTTHVLGLWEKLF